MAMHCMVLEVVPSTLLMYCAQVVVPAYSSATVFQYYLAAAHTQRMLESSVKVLYYGIHNAIYANVRRRDRKVFSIE